MAIGDAGEAAGFGKVPESGTDRARVRYGAEEINKTRDSSQESRRSSQRPRRVSARQPAFPQGPPTQPVVTTATSTSRSSCRR